MQSIKFTNMEELERYALDLYVPEKSHQESYRILTHQKPYVFLSNLNGEGWQWTIGRIDSHTRDCICVSFARYAKLYRGD